MWSVGSTPMAVRSKVLRERQLMAAFISNRCQPKTEGQALQPKAQIPQLQESWTCRPCNFFNNCSIICCLFFFSGAFGIVMLVSRYCHLHCHVAVLLRNYFGYGSILVGGLGRARQGREQGKATCPEQPIAQHMTEGSGNGNNCKRKHCFEE